jgi:hypothetical protein
MENFCRWFVQQTFNPQLFSSMPFTGETNFGRDGITNFHNQHKWAEENPRGTIHAKHQVQFKIKASVGIVCMIGTHKVLPSFKGSVCWKMCLWQ